MALKRHEAAKGGRNMPFVIWACTKRRCQPMPGVCEDAVCRLLNLLKHRQTAVWEKGRLLNRHEAAYL